MDIPLPSQSLGYRKTSCATQYSIGRNGLTAEHDFENSLTACRLRGGATFINPHLLRHCLQLTTTVELLLHLSALCQTMFELIT